jgi:putative hydrolase of the HAD superfamily
MVKACLVDVYDTILNSAFPERVQAIADWLGVGVDDWLAEWSKGRTERDRGKLSIASSFAQALPALGIEPKPELIDDLVRKDTELMRARTYLFEDTVPFLAGLRSGGVLIALVSNCADTTRGLLEYKGVIPLADSVILSCEVGSMKPSPEIYVSALEDLGVAAADAAFIDDQPGFCVGAEAVGVRAIQIARDIPGVPAPGSGFPVVRSLSEAAGLLG